jgi:tetratricopeptide (TPR) repeat protein
MMRRLNLRRANRVFLVLTATLLHGAGSGTANAQPVDCAGVAETFEARMALSPGAADEDGAFILLRREAEHDLSSCPDLEPQRYAVARMAELGYSATRARRGTAEPDARVLAEEALRQHPGSARIATVEARLDGSVQAAQRAAGLDPGYGPARTALAAALARQGDTAAALASLAGDASGLSRAALIERARIKLDRGDAKGALADLRAVDHARQREMEPTPGFDSSRDTEELLGLSLSALGKTAQARKHLQQAASMGSAKAQEALARPAPTAEYRVTLPSGRKSPGGQNI